MAINSWDKGDVVKCSGVFTDAAGVATDPAAVFFAFINPNGAQTTYTYGTDAQLVKDSTGTYHANIDADIEGVYYWRMYSTGNGKAAAEGQFLVKDSVF